MNYTEIVSSKPSLWTHIGQGYHHNGDQAARQSRNVLNLWSPICDPSVWAGGSRGWAHSPAFEFILAPH